MNRNERGITLIILAIVIIFVVAIIVAIRSNSNNIGTNSEWISAIKEKETRSEYISKCTTIDYKSLVENSSQYEGKDFTFTGEVIEVNTSLNNVKLRVNVTPKTSSEGTHYSDTIYVNYEYSNYEERRILDGDIITIYGKSEGLYSYTALTGPERTINLPSIMAMYIDIKEN